MVTIILIVSRDRFLKDVFACINALVCDSSATALFVYVDGDLNLFQKVREFVRVSKYDNRICVYRKKGIPSVSNVRGRRDRIAKIHKEIATYLTNANEYVLLLEDDTIIPPWALQDLLNDIIGKSNVGLVSGVELGRWGYTHIGAWRVDNCFEPESIESIGNEDGLVEIDASGLYCCMTKLSNYLEGDFMPFEKILGPDFSFGLGLRKKGLVNYANMEIKCIHKTPKEDITFENSKIIGIKFDKINEDWKMTANALS